MSQVMSMMLMIGLLGGVAFLIWKRCELFPSICSNDPNSLFYDGTKGTLEGKTFGEKGFTDSGVVNPGSTPLTKTTVNTPPTPSTPGVKTKKKTVIAGGRVVAPPAPKVQATCKVVNGKLVGVDSSGNVIGDCKSGLGAYARAMSAMTVTGERMSYF